MIEKLANVDRTHEFYPSRRPSTDGASLTDAATRAAEPIPANPPVALLEELDRAAVALNELASRGLRVSLEINAKGETIQFEIVDGKGNVGQISSVRLLDLLNGGGAEGLLFDAVG